MEQTSIQGIYDIAFRHRFGAEEEAIGKPGDFTVVPMQGDASYAISSIWRPL